MTATEPVYDYLFITHEHFDHCHPPTLQRLCRGDRFRRLYASPGCVEPAQPVAQVYGDAAFERDLPIMKSVAPDRVQVLHPGVTSSLIGAGREFPSSRPRDLEGIAVEVVESGESASPDLPTCGYLETSVSIYHTGDLPRNARERRELLFAKTLLPLPRSVSFGTETGLQLQALRERRRETATPDA